MFARGAVGEESGGGSRAARTRYHRTQMNHLRTPLFGVAAAMVAFAANSLLCRLALRDPVSIDPVTFTSVRLLSGAAILSVIAMRRGGGVRTVGGNGWSAAALFVYAICFSVAYLGMTAGTGALILFAFVQLTMVVFGVLRGERPSWLQWSGFAIAITGLVVLSWRGIAAPDPLSSLLMATAGIAWGVYSLRGRVSARPLADTAGNFVRSVPLALVASLLATSTFHLSSPGLLLAVTSGAIASGLGYSIWYLVLPSLTSTRAAVVQLAVPAIAAAGGIVLLGEPATLRFAAASAMILTGVAMAVLPKRHGRLQHRAPGR